MRLVTFIDRLKFRASVVVFAPAAAAGVAAVFAASIIAAFVLLFSVVCRRCPFSKDGRGAQCLKAVCNHFLSSLFSFISFVCSFLASTTIDSLLVFGCDLVFERSCVFILLSFFLPGLVDDDSSRAPTAVAFDSDMPTRIWPLRLDDIHCGSNPISGRSPHVVE